MKNRLLFLLALCLCRGVRADAIKQGTAYNRDILVTDSSGANVTGKLSGDFTVKASKANGAQATVTLTITEKGLGHYNMAYPTSLTDTVGSLSLIITTTGAVQVDVGDQIFDVLTADVMNRIGANGAGLTALGDTRLANLDANVSSRSTYAGGDTAGTTALLGRIPGTIQPQTGDAFARIGAQGAGLTAITTTLGQLPFDLDGMLLSRTHSYVTGKSPDTIVLGASAAAWNTANTIGAKINSAALAGAGSDPFLASTATAYGNGTFGALIKANLANPVPADYQQRGIAVTLPNGAGTYYAPVTFVSGTTVSTNLTLSVATNPAGKPVLTWSSDPIAISYKVLRSVEGTIYTVIAQGLTTTTYTDTSAPVGTVRYTVLSNH